VDKTEGVDGDRIEGTAEEVGGERVAKDGI